jgi:hypothetical protein
MRAVRAFLALLGFAGTLAAQVVISLSPSTLPNVTVGDFYFESITASGGSGSYDFQLSGGTLPPGLSLNSGFISGAPSTPGGPFSFTVRATDLQSGASGTRGYSITVNPPPVITPTTMPPTTVGANYNHTIAVSGGTPPFTFVDDGGLPPGVSLSSSGVLTGTPTSAGVYSVPLSVYDSSGTMGSFLGNGGFRAFTGGSNANAFANITIVVNSAPAITRLTLPNGFLGTVYNQTITATGGTGALTYTLSSGALPSGLSLNSTTGVLSGSPTARRIRSRSSARLQSQRPRCSPVLLGRPYPAPSALRGGRARTRGPSARGASPRG